MPGLQLLPPRCSPSRQLLKLYGRGATFGGWLASTAVEGLAFSSDRPPRCPLRSDDTEASFGVASGRLAVGSGLMLTHFCADERLLPSARERVRFHRRGE